MKFKANNIKNYLNKKFGSFGKKKSSFQIENDKIVCPNFAKVVPPESATHFCELVDRIENKYKGEIQNIKAYLKRNQYNVQVHVIIDKKGFVSLLIFNNDHLKTDLGWSYEKEETLIIKRNKK